MKKLKTAVAGLGRIGWGFHVPGVADNDGFELIAVCDPVEERLNEARDKYGAATYTDFNKMIEAEKPELTVIATPTHYHAEQAVYAMNAGSDVFLDKPMARDLTEADKIIAVKVKTGRKLMMYQPHRASVATQKTKEIIDSGVIGDVFMIKTASCDFVFRDDWQSFKKYGGGMLNNSAAHWIDMVLYLSGSSAARIEGHMRRVASVGDADDVVKLLIETKNKITIDVDIIMAAAIHMPRVIVYGSCGAITETYKGDKNVITTRYFDPSEQTRFIADDGLAAKNRKYVTSVPVNWKETEDIVEYDKGIKYYDRCYDYFALNNAPFVDVKETREVMRVMEECRKSAGWSQDQ